MINKIICVVVILVPTLFFGYNGKPAEMGVSLVAGALTACFLNLDRFSSFKGGGFEAQLREVKDTVDQAMVTVENFKNIMKPLLLSTIHNITYTGRWGGPPVDVNEEILQGCKEIIKQLDLHTPELKGAITTYNRYMARDAYVKMASVIKGEDCCNEMSTEIQDAFSIKDLKNGNFPSINDVQTLLKEKGVAWEDISKNGKDAIDWYNEKLQQYIESIS